MIDVFRNVEGAAADPVSEWPYEALVAAIERGTLQDWRPIMAEIRARPWGELARRVESYLGYASPYGVGPLLRRTIELARERQTARERAEVARRVRELIAASGLSRAEFARAIGTSRSRLSTYASGAVVPAATMLIRMELRSPSSGTPPD